MQRWIVVAAGILVMLGPGAVYSFSLLSAPLAASFGWSSSEVVWAFAMANFFLAVGGLIGGAISDRIGPRVVSMIGITLWAAGYALCGLLTESHSIVMLYLCYGVIGGLGCGMAYMAALNSVIRWFPKTHGLGSGLVIAGFGFGSFVYNAIAKGWAPYLALSKAGQAYTTALSASIAAHVPFDPTSYLLPKASVSQLMTMFFVSGAVFLVLGVAGSVFLAFPPEEDPVYAAQYRGEQFTLPQMLGDARFYIIYATMFLCIFGGITMISNMVPLMHELTDMPLGDAAGLYAFLAIFNGFGRVLWGYLSDRIGRRMTLVLLFAGQAVAFISLGNNHEIAIVGISIALLLLCYGGGFAVLPAFNADFFGTRNFGANYGMQLSAWGLAGVAGTGLGSLLRDVTGSFSGMTQPLAIILIVAIFFPLILGEAQRQALETA